MLTITVPKTDLWDEANECFIPVKEQELQLEHSLISLSKWESKWHKSFLHTNEKTYEETVDYIRCMTLTHNVNPDVYRCLTKKNIDEIHEYIEDSMTATVFLEDRLGGGKNKREVVTSELIYYWMIANNIPFECQEWHLNRLITLIRVCSVKNTPPKKRSKSEIMNRNAALNAARREQMKSKG